MSENEKTELTRELQDRSHDIDGHPIGLASVKQSARRIRRRRRIASGAVAAAVLALAVPTALAVANGTDRSADPVAPSPSPSPTQTAEPRPDGTFVLTTEDLERGDDPRVSYISAKKRELVTPDATIAMSAVYQAVAPYDGGWLAVRTGPSGYEIVTLDAAGEVTGTTPGGPSLVTSDDGSRVGYVEVDPGSGRSTLVSAPTDGSAVTTWPMPPDREASVVGFLDRDSVVYQTDGVKQIIGVARADGRTTGLEGFLRVTAASEANGLVAGMVSFADQGACWGVMDPAASSTALVWRTCDYSLRSFSPDGRFIVAGDAYDDALGEPMLAILDAGTSDPVVEYTQGRRGQGEIIEAVWEDDDSLLATVLGGRSWTMLRANTSGGLEEVVDPVPADSLDLPFWFASGRQ